MPYRSMDYKESLTIAEKMLAEADKFHEYDAKKKEKEVINAASAAYEHYQEVLSNIKELAKAGHIRTTLGIVVPKGEYKDHSRYRRLLYFFLKEDGFKIETSTGSNMIYWGKRRPTLLQKAATADEAELEAKKKTKEASKSWWKRQAR